MASPSIPPGTPQPDIPQPPLIPAWKSSKARSWGLLFVFLLLLALLGEAALKLSPGLNFAISAAVMTLAVLLLGQWSCRRPLGVLIDYRNLMSLARFQSILWTIIVLSGFLAMVALRLRFPIPGRSAMDVGIPWELWALMGISTTSLVGAPLILEGKLDKTPTQDAVDKASATLHQSSPSLADVSSMGTLYRNPALQDARITDMLQGDEIVNITYLDMAKVQMMLFTIVGALVYSGVLYQLLTNPVPANLTQMPALSQGMITLLGISHAGYLGSKTVDRTPST
jgi:hypothetical protein